MPKLIYHDSSGARGTVEMGTEPVIIGRANDCQIQTQDGLVSRRHAKVIFDGRYYFIEDNGSANGVYVGAERVQRHQLRGGDVFRCGHLEVRFDVEDLNRTGIGMMSGGQVVLGQVAPQAPRQASVAPPVVAPPPPVAAPPPPVAAPPPMAPPPMAPPPMAPPQLSDLPTAPVRAGGRPAPSSSSNPPGAHASHLPSPPVMAPMGPGDMTGRMTAGASGVRPPQLPIPSAAPPPALSLGFEGVPPVRPAQAGMPAASGAAGNNAELAALRGEVEAERRRRVEVESERDVAVRRAEEAQRQAAEAQRQAAEAQRRADEAQRQASEASARPADGETERLRRRVEQLESEVRRKGGGGGGGGGGAMGEALRAAENERDKLKTRVAELEPQLAERDKLKARITEVETQLAGYAAYFGGGAAAVAPAAKVAELEAEVRRLSAELESEKKRAGGGAGEELERARRRIEQLESDARRRPVGAVTEEKRVADMRTELEAALRQLRDLERERDSLREAISRGAGGPGKTPQAVIDSLTTVSDGLADVRAALRAAGDELALEQLEQIRGALRQACSQLGISL